MPAGRVKTLDGKHIRLLVGGGWSVDVEREIAAGGFDRLEFHHGDYDDFRCLLPYKAQVKAIALFSGEFGSAAGLAELDELRSLSVGPALKGLDFSTLARLEELNLDGWLPRYAKTLFQCANLKSLRIEGYDGANCERIGELRELRRLTLAKGKLSSLQGLAACGKLASIHLAHLRKLSDISEIERIPTLRELELSEALPALQQFDVTFRKTALKRLDLRALDVELPDISWLSQFTKLHLLAIRNVVPMDWDALFASRDLKKIAVTFAKSTGLSVDQVRDIALAHGLRPTQIGPIGVAAKQKGYWLEFRPDGSTQNLWYWDESQP
ncbi:MAG: hypothetical protein E6K53_08275 [Gammaproteobacteria bacterium]|nr:MAG: hypothetical protein E6K53_08275 [Gammaproteobacteria bacterium]